MRTLKQWFIPVLTCLVVAAAALAPQQLSAFRDRELTGSVHAEALDGDNNFSVWSPTLTERIVLLAQLESGGSSISSVSHQLEGTGLREAEALALAGLAELVDAGVFPPDTVPEQLSYSYGEQLYLWTPENLGGAAFYRLSMEDTGRGWSASLALDGESGKIVRISLFMEGVGDWQGPPEYMGKLFLNWLDVDWALFGAGSYDAVLTLSGTDIAWIIAQGGHNFQAIPLTRETLGLGPDLPPELEQNASESIRFDIYASDG